VIAVDTNVLLHAHRRELPRHAESLAALRRLAEGAVPWALPVFCLAEFVRIATHPRVFRPPSTHRQAFAALNTLQESPSCRLLLPDRCFREIFERLCHEHDLRGNRVFDAQIAAVCLEHGANEILTFDRDFARIREIKIVATDKR